MESAAVSEPAVAEVTVCEITVMEVIVTEVSAMGDEGVMVKECTMAIPVIAPVAPAPSKSSEEADTKPNSKTKAEASPKNPGHGIPAWVGDDGFPVHQPRIIGRYVDHLGAGWFDDDGLALRGHILLFVCAQMPCVTGLLT